MGHIYCNKAAGVSTDMTLSATSLALPPQRTHSPRLLYSSFLWQRSAQRTSLLIVNSQLAPMDAEKRKREARASLHDVFMVTGVPLIFSQGRLILCSEQPQHPPTQPTHTHHHVPSSTPRPSRLPGRAGPLGPLGRRNKDNNWL